MERELCLESISGLYGGFCGVAIQLPISHHGTIRTFPFAFLVVPLDLGLKLGFMTLLVALNWFYRRGTGFEGWRVRTLLRSYYNSLRDTEPLHAMTYSNAFCCPF